MKRNVCPVLFFVISLMVSSCTSDPPIRIGLLTGTSGNMLDAGISARYALQLALKTCNDNGGIKGRRVELIVKDNQSDAEAAVKDIKVLIAQKVDAIVGPMSSTVALSILPYLNDAGIVTISPTATTPLLTGRDDYFFRVCTTTEIPARVSAEYQLRSGGILRIAIAWHDGNPGFSEAFLESFKMHFLAGGGTILSVVKLSSKDNRSYLQIAHGMLKDDPDGILVIANTMESALLCQQIRKLSRSVKITLSNWSGTQRFLTLGGHAVEGVTLPIAVNWESREPRYREFRKTFIEHFQRAPEYASLNTYDAALVLLAALKERLPGQDLKTAILSLDGTNGLFKEINFDAYGDLKNPSAVMYTVHNHRFQPLE